MTGELRVTTNPALPSQILVDGVPRDSFGLNWLDLPPGSYTVSFTHVEGYTEPAPQTVTVNAGATTTVQGNFVQRGSLRVITSPAVPGTITVDGIPRTTAACGPTCRSARTPSASAPSRASTPLPARTTSC